MSFFSVKHAGIAVNELRRYRGDFPSDLIELPRTGVGVSRAQSKNNVNAEFSVQTPHTADLVVLALKAPLDIRVEMDDQKVWHGRFEDGMVQILPRGAHLLAQVTGPFDFLHIAIPQVLTEKLAGELLIDSPSKLRSIRNHGYFRNPVLEHLGRGILATMEEAEPVLAQLKAETLALSLAAHILSHPVIDVTTFATDRNRGLPKHCLCEIIHMVEARLAGPISVAELAVVAGLSVFHFVRVFKQSTGLTPGRFIQTQRVKKARELLTGTNASVLEVAAAVGYDDPSHFSAVFRRELGMCPREYRLRH